MAYTALSRFFLYLVPLTVVIVTRSTLFPFITGKYSWFRFAVAASLVFFLVGLFDPKDGYDGVRRLKRVLKSPLTIAVSLFTLFFLLSVFLGFNPSYSFWSNFERGEGGFQILSLFVFFILTSSLFTEKKQWIKLFWVSIASTLAMVFYGAGAGLGWQGFIGLAFRDTSFRFQGSIGNPAYVAALLLFSISYAAYIWLDKYKVKSRWRSAGSVFLIASVLVFLVFFLLAATRGAFVGLIAGALSALVFIALQKRAWRKYAVVVGIALLIAVSVMVKFKDSPLVQSIPGARIFDLSLSAETLQHRAIMWGIAWESFKERPIFGWGPESFGYLFQRNFDPEYFSPATGFGAWFDRAHSIFFDYLAETGILGFLSYLGMFIVAGVALFGNKASGFEPTVTQKALVVAALVAYLVQGLALFDVLVIYINIFLTLAFVNRLSEKPPANDRGKPAVRRAETELPFFARPFVFALIALALVSMYLTYRSFSKGQRYIQAVQAARSSTSIGEFTTIYDSVFEYRAPVSEVEITKFFGGDVIQALANGNQAEEISRELLGYLEAQTNKSDVIQLLNLAIAHQTIIKKYGREEDLRKSLEYFEAARRIAPNLPQPLYNLFDMYRAMEDFDKAREVGNVIVKNWGDEKIKSAMEGFRQGNL